MRNRSSQGGFTIVGQLVGLFTALLAFAGIGACIVYAGRLQQKAQVVNQMLSLENALLSWSSDRAAVLALAPNLKAGQIPAGAEIVINGKTLAKVGALQTQGRDLGPCPEVRDCWTTTEVAIRCDPGASGLVCAMAYRIQATRDDITRFGTAHGRAFEPADFSVPLSFEITERVQSAQCDSAQDLFASGFNKNTGNIICLRKPTKPCASGEIAKGLQFNPARQSLEPLCEPVPSVTCPQHYAVLSLNLTSLHPGQSAQGTCVIVTQKEVPWQTSPPPAASVTGRFCPAHYKTKARCDLTNVVQSPGSCQYSCNCSTDPAGATSCETCSCTVQPVPGTVNLTDGTREASCQVQTPPQPSCPCGAQAVWTAQAKLTGTCQLNEADLPETKPL